MIFYLIVLNRQGKVRLSKWYQSYDAEEKRRLGNEIHKAIMQRPKGYTNFVDVRRGKRASCEAQERFFFSHFIFFFL